MYKFLKLFALFLIYIFNLNVFADTNFEVWKNPNAENNIIRTNDNKVGLTNKNNIILLNPDYDSIEDFGDNSTYKQGKACYKKIVYRIETNKLYGLADTKGNILYEPQFDEITWVGYNNIVQNRYLKVKKENKYALFDIHKKTLTDFIFDDIKVSHDQITITIDGKTQYLHKGKTILTTAAAIIFSPLVIPAAAIMAILGIMSLVFG